jgi:hypothetical protein
VPDGLGVLAIFVGVVILMVFVFWGHKQVAGRQELLVQITRTAIALVATFSVFYAMLHAIAISEGLLALYGVIITLYFKGDKILRDDGTEEKAES